MVSWKDARTIIEAGHPEGWGRLLDFPVNKDRSGLGYHSQPLIVKKTMQNVMEGEMLPLSDIFTSARYLMDEKISVVENKEDNVIDKEGLVYQKLQELEN